ncbi:MAG TPA: SCO family protein [Conexibacter sp.]|nr:SCO family protein [Conexibacter sp.]
MPARLRLTLVVTAVCALAALAGVALIAASGSSDEASGDAGPTGLHGALPPPQARAIDFRLRDQNGRVATMDQYRGRFVIVTFMYSTCRDTCPLTAQQIRGALDQLGHDVPVLAISVDPAGDTPANVRRFLAEQQMARRMRYLTGTHAQLAPVWRAYGIQPETAESEHTASTVIDDGAGRQRVGYLTDQLTPEALAADLQTLSGPGGARASR